MKLPFDLAFFRSLMLIEGVLVTVLLAAFHPASRSSSYAFASILWLLYLSFCGVYAMHPAVISRTFGGNGLDSVAIGFVGSSDMVNNRKYIGVKSNAKGELYTREISFSPQS